MSPSIEEPDTFLPGRHQVLFEARFGNGFGASLAAIERAEREQRAAGVAARVDLDRALVTAALRGDAPTQCALRSPLQNPHLARTAIATVRAEAQDRRQPTAAPIAVANDLAGHDWARHARGLVKDALIDAYQSRGRFREGGERGGQYPIEAPRPRYEQRVQELADYLARVGTSLQLQVAAGAILARHASASRAGVVAAAFRPVTERVADRFREFAQRALPRLQEDVERALGERGMPRSALHLEPRLSDPGLER